MTFRLLQKQFLCKPHCMINSSQCPLDPSQHVYSSKRSHEQRTINSPQCSLDPSQQVYSAKRSHEQRTFTKTRSLCKHFRHGITCHVIFQLLQKLLKCKPHCTINSSQCSLHPSQLFYSAKWQHELRTFAKTRSLCKHFRHRITCHVTFQLL